MIHRPPTRFEIMRRNRRCIQFTIGKVEADIAWAEHLANIASDREAEGHTTETWLKETLQRARARKQPSADFYLTLPPEPGLLRRLWDYVTGDRP